MHQVKDVLDPERRAQLQIQLQNVALMMAKIKEIDFEIAIGANIVITIGFKEYISINTVTSPNE